MKIILSNASIVVGIVVEAAWGDGAIITEQGTFVGEDLQIVDSDDSAIAIGMKRSGDSYELLMHTQQIAVETITKFMDDFAAEKHYDNIQSAALRAGYPGPFHDEGVKYAQWMDGCWAKCYEVLAKVLIGIMEIPTKSELLALMPEKPTFDEVITDEEVPA